MAGIVFLATFFVVSPSIAQSLPAASGSDPETGSAATLPSYLKNIDLTLPSQEAFRGWPPKELLERAYWLPWTWLSFQRAKTFDRPVLFLMTVPWNRLAQRMEIETLSDPRVVRAINEGYVAIRVDAERRPDIRVRYQTGEWPVLALLLPDGTPILSQANPTGKALPITTGFLDVERMLFVLQEGKTYYERWSGLLRGVGEYWARGEWDPPPVGGEVRELASDELARWLVGNADHGAGGFGAAPKFVVGGLAEYAQIREARLAPALSEHARITLEKMIASPLFDRREGGVHRIAMAPGWRGIQYEKTLASNTKLVRDLVFGLGAGDSAELRAALAQTCAYLTRVLARPGGGFFVAEAADPDSPDGSGFWGKEALELGAARPPVVRLALSGENALAGAALLRAGILLGDSSLEETGRQALDLVLSRSYQTGRGVSHVVDPRPEPHVFLESQADVAFGLLDGYETTGNPAYRRAARDLADFVENNLLVPGETAFRDRIPDPNTPGILRSPRRPLEANARMARVLLRLSALGEPDHYRARALSILSTWAGDLAAYGVHGIEAAMAVEEIVRDTLRIEIEGMPGDPKSRALRRAALALAWPWKVIATASEAPKQRAVAVLRWKGASVRVDRPERIAAEATALTGAPMGGSSREGGR